MKHLSDKELDEGLKKIPAMSSTVQDVLVLLDQKDVDFRQVENKVMEDANLTARLLRVANSPMYGLSGQIHTIRDACRILGLRVTKNLVTTAWVMGAFPGDPKGRVNTDELWQHAQGTAALSVIIANKIRACQESAFVTGLLHDIGKIVYLMGFPEHYDAVLDYRDEHNVLLWEAEQKILKIDHAELGARLAKSWNLPLEVIEGIGFHHEPMTESLTAAPVIVHCADIICRGLELGDGGDNRIPTFCAEALRRHKITMTLINESLSEAVNLVGNQDLMAAAS